MQDAPSALDDLLFDEDDGGRPGGKNKKKDKKKDKKGGKEEDDEPMETVQAVEVEVEAAPVLAGEETLEAKVGVLRTMITVPSHDEQCTGGTGQAMFGMAAQFELKSKTSSHMYVGGITQAHNSCRVLFFVLLPLYICAHVNIL